MSSKTKPANVQGNLTIHDEAPEFDVHKYDYQLANTKELAKKNLSASNYKLYCEYDNVMIRNAFAKATRLKQLKTILNLSKYYGREWNKVTREDIRRILTTIMEYHSRKTGQETNTTYDHKKILRLFVRWVITGVRERDPHESELDILKDVKMRKVPNTLVREEMITDEDMIMFSNACGGDLMFKALIWTAYDAGTRPSELLTLRIQHIVIQSDGWIIKVDGKTGQRIIHLFKSVPYLSTWLNAHPFRARKDWPLWINSTNQYYGRPLSYRTARKKLNALSISGNQKKLFLNLFRHSEITKASKFMPEALLKKRHGWSPNSKVAANYQHLVQDDVKEAMQKHYGIETEEKKELLDQKCGNCGTVNPLDIEICNFCHLPISLEKRLELQKQKEEDTRQITRDEFFKLKEEMNNDTHSDQ